MFKKNNSNRELLSVEDVKGGLNQAIPETFLIDDVYFVCIGTDRSTGDCLGPMVGTMLEDLGYNNVIGTIDSPIHAVNLVESLESIPLNKHVIAIDACLGKHTSVGSILIDKGSLRPGAALQKDLPAVGDSFIKGIVNVGGFMEFAVLQNTRLKVVRDLALKIVAGIQHRFPLSEKEEIVCTKKIM